MPAKCSNCDWSEVGLMVPAKCPKCGGAVKSASASEVGPPKETGPVLAKKPLIVPQPKPAPQRLVVPQKNKIGALSEEDLKQIAGFIVAKEGGEPFALAFETYQNITCPVVYYQSGAQLSKVPHDAIIDVLQRICDTHATRRQFHLLYSHESLLTKKSRGMMRFLENGYGPLLADPAKDPKPRPVLRRVEPRQKGLDAFCDFKTGEDPGLDLLAGGQEYHTADRLYLMAAYALTAERVEKGSGHQQDYNIGAILVSRSGEILAWGLNTRSQNLTTHAEVNTIQSYRRRTGMDIPADARLYTTLKPCSMCAGMIADCFSGKFRVIYGQNDPGDHAQGTFLDTIPGHLIHVGDGGTKALKIYDSEHYPSPAVDGNLMGTFEDEKKTFLTEFLGKKNVVSKMKEAGLALKRKSEKYAAADPSNNPVVLRILRHLSPFLESRGLPLIDERVFNQVDLDLMLQTYLQVKDSIRWYEESKETWDEELDFQLAGKNVHALDPSTDETEPPAKRQET